MEAWQALILGIVEGVTEYLPISSTGHLIITSALLGLTEPPETKQAVDAFNIVIQGGAILAVLGLYRQRVWRMILGLLGRDPAGRRLFFNLLLAFLPAAVLGPFLDDWIETRLFHPVPVIAALALGGIAMLALGPWQRKHFHDSRGEGGGEDDGDGAGDDRGDSRSYVDIEHLTWRRALVIGLLQCVAMWPGTSRSMMTIMGGMLVGLRPKQAAEFSFLLGLPTLGGACVYKGAKNLLGDGPNMFEVLGTTEIIVGVAAATIAAALAIKWLVGYLSRHGLAVFGWYRVALSAVLAILIWREVVSLGV